MSVNQPQTIAPDLNSEYAPYLVKSREASDLGTVLHLLLAAVPRHR